MGQTRATIETLLPKSFLMIHEIVTKIIKDNNLSPKEEEAKVDNSDRHNQENPLQSVVDNLTAKNLDLEV
jgi:hypothetical protein